MPSLSNLILMLFSLLLAYSCSQKQTSVKLEVSQNFVFGGSETSAIAGGGLMVWGRNSQGLSFGQALEGRDSISLDLPPGSWTFYAMAWEGNRDYQEAGPTTDIVFGGTVRCGKSPVTTLEKDAVQVQLTISNANCVDSAFAGSIAPTVAGGDNILPPTRFNFCSHVGPLLTGPGTLCADTVSDTRRVYPKAAIASFRVKMPNFLGPALARQFLPGGIIGECVNFTGDNESGEIAALYGTSSIKVPGLPAGGIGLPFHITLEMFPGPDCDTALGARGAITKEFINGIAFANNTDNKYFIHANDHRQYVALSPATVCAPRGSITLPDHPFAGGDGSQDRPYIICSVPQWYAINSNSGSYLNSHIKLQADLDFNHYSKGLGLTALPAISYGGQTLTNLFDCLESGSNFIPIGFIAPNCSGPGNTLVFNTALSFMGSFQGGNFKIKNLRLRAEYQDNLGLFADFTGSHLGNITLVSSEISGGAYVGALAGYANGTTIWSIQGTNLDIEARSNSVTYSKVGSLVGALENSTVNTLKVYNSKVRGEASHIGGIIGYANVVTATKIAAEVDVDGNSAVEDQTDIGGVIGHAMDSNLSFVKHEGGIYTDAKQVGGILGSSNGNTSLTDFYANSHVMTYDGDTANRLGGVVGFWNSNFAVNFGPGYSMSMVRSKCVTGCTQGAVAGEITIQPDIQNTVTTLLINDSGAGGVAPTFTAQTGMSLAGFTTTLGGLTYAGTDDWNHQSGQYSRFDFENHPCLNTVITSSGNGSSNLPYVICNLSDYLGISETDATTGVGVYYKLLANIRLVNETTPGAHQYEIQNFNGHLLGNNKSLIGGFVDTITVPNTGHIFNLNANASVSNLNIHGMGRKTNDSIRSNPHGVFVANNYGTLNNIQSWTYPKWPSFGHGFGSGFVGINKPGAVISNVIVDGIINGGDGLSTIAGLNQGTIKDSRSNGEINCIEGAGCYNIAGLVLDNEGTIERTEMSSRLENNGGSGFIYSASMVVDNNDTTGILRDVLVSEHATFKINADPASEAYYFHNTNAGNLIRVLNRGKFTAFESTYAASMAGFPTDITATDPGTGTHTDVLRTGGRSGKVLLEDSVMSCSDTDTLTIDWPAVSDPAWDTAFTGGVYTGFLDPAHKLIVHVKLDNDTSFTQRLITYDGVTSFDIPLPLCTGINGKLDLYYTNDLAVNNTGAALAGTMLPQNAYLIGSYTGTWPINIWEQTADEAAILNYFASMMGLTSTQVTPRAWELDNKGLSLFKRD